MSDKFIYFLSDLMFITKSLFKEFIESPKLAWFHINDKEIYKNIQENMY
ncbi:MAG: hypothetical protein WCH65_03025 [bacterium]